MSGQTRLSNAPRPAEAAAARNLPLAAGQTIVVLADQFPSNLYVAVGGGARRRRLATGT